MQVVAIPSEDQQDLALAAKVQSALLPKASPVDSPHQAMGVRNRMCRSVGGDFYDFISLNNEQLAIVIGDVVGHGVRAALLMAQIMGFLRSATHDLSRPASVARNVNEMLIRLGDETDTILPCSLLYTVIDLPTGLGFMINAGHPRPLLCDRATCASGHLGGHSLVLGVERYELHEICHTFTPGDRLVLYTDGILDAADADHELFGEGRLMDVLRTCPDKGPQQTADAVMDAVAAFRGQAPQSDDETVFVIDRL